ncbi:MAG TPA: hypothetical protein EYQ86_07760 [Bacteroidetes bacterium]|nr:hypothetical protein [Bacteroidota bacterium]
MSKQIGATFLICHYNIIFINKISTHTVEREKCWILLRYVGVSFNRVKYPHPAPINAQIKAQTGILVIICAKGGCGSRFLMAGISTFPEMKFFSAYPKR